ncbi:hypothetical protein L204_100494 [Cryptococcus depauperatus]|nr:hypothetical protein L204_06390 [Cryptococcus depauperatus CBS 7855]
MTQLVPTYYDILGIEEDAGPVEIRKAYLRAAAQCHPDKRPDDPSAKEEFQLVQEAYEVLSDVEEKVMYDRKLSRIRGGCFEEIMEEGVFASAHQPPPPPHQPTNTVPLRSNSMPHKHPLFTYASSRYPSRPRYSPPPPFHPLYRPSNVPSGFMWSKWNAMQPYHLVPPRIGAYPPTIFTLQDTKANAIPIMASPSPWPTRPPSTEHVRRYIYQRMAAERMRMLEVLRATSRRQATAP